MYECLCECMNHLMTEKFARFVFVTQIKLLNVIYILKISQRDQKYNIIHSMAE